MSFASYFLCIIIIYFSFSSLLLIHFPNYILQENIIAAWMFTGNVFFKCRKCYIYVPHRSQTVVRVYTECTRCTTWHWRLGTMLTHWWVKCYSVNHHTVFRHPFKDLKSLAKRRLIQLIWVKFCANGVGILGRSGRALLWTSYRHVKEPVHTCK